MTHNKIYEILRKALPDVAPVQLEDVAWTILDACVVDPEIVEKFHAAGQYWNASAGQFDNDGGC
jgi:hypothetical protein